MKIRPATDADVALLLRWRNDPGTVRWLDPPRLVSDEDHRAWCHARLAGGHFYMADVDGACVGTGRLEPRMELSITLAPEHRGRGYATPLILAVAERAETPVWARILPGNTASIRAFLKAGFRVDPAGWYHR